MGTAVSCVLCPAVGAQARYCSWLSLSLEGNCKCI
uniref:Uncharacterized protein n=1 Tax=Phakopsora pachyrhizi TaxID=170000 RepID=A0A0S1MJQ7_PHAPC